MTDSYQQVVDRFQDAMFVKHDPRAAAQVYAEDAVLTDPTTAGQIKGRKAIEGNLANILRGFPDMSCETRNVFASDGWFAAEFTVRGTHRGPLEVAPGQVIPPTGKPAEMMVCWIGRLDAKGEVAQDTTYYDSASLLQQLGLMG
jgi:steroid delta-isomerase-like uncharacterized protein